MENPKILIYDGSFNGFLTTVFKIFEEKIQVANIQRNKGNQKGLFCEPITVFTQMDKARRVWYGIQHKSNAAIKAIYFAFLSESKGMELLLYQYICSMYDHSNDEIAEITLKIQQYSRMVAREKYRIEAIANFTMSQDHIYFSQVAPGFDVLPLISKHFRAKFKSQEFIIYDSKRRYAIYYNLDTVEIISLELSIFHIEEDIPQTPLKQLINNKLHSQYHRKTQMGYLNERAVV